MSPPPQKRRQPRLWRRVLVIAALFGILAVIADWADYTAWEQVKRASVPTAGQVLAIHEHDDFINPSTVDVDLRSAPPRHLAVRTNEEELYHVGQRVTVLYDVKHPDRAGFIGDSTGPTWTLGAGYIGMLGAALFALLTVLNLITHGIRRAARHRRTAPVLTPERQQEIEAAIGELIAQKSLGSNDMDAPLVGPTIRHRQIAWQRKHARAALIAFAVALAALAIHVGFGHVRFGLDSFVLRIAGAWAIGLVAALIQNAGTLRYAEQLRWVTVIAARLNDRTDDILIVEDPQHAGIFRPSRLLKPALAFAGEDGPGWAARYDGKLYFHPTEAGTTLTLHYVDRWQGDSKIKLAGAFSRPWPAVLARQQDKVVTMDDLT